MPWNQNGPPKRSNYDIAFKRMQSAEKSFQRKECFAIVNDEVQKLLEQDFVMKVPTEELDQSTRMVSAVASSLHTRENH